ncbi:ATP-dependent RNA helicase DHX30 [Caerostris extrusa]|uniref:ATP-dependent RNA helicase DHX30 n=1 Tax=Caerostris extrusa TaxID=172846 RepID=A0AAV4X8U7_CAEEX|nr:ATP-dependent RNA helicase DHX30 [Caerostris extrusa]
MLLQPLILLMMRKIKKLWKVSIYMKWPQKFCVSGISSKKTEAENLSFLHACQKMKEYGLLDKDNKPLIPDKTNFTEKFLKSSKCDLLNLFHIIWLKQGKKTDILPKFENTNVAGIFGKNSFWECQLQLMYPEKRFLKSSATRLKDAESIAAAKALFWLRDISFINNKNRLIQYSSQDETKLLNYHLAPYSICIPPLLQDKMTSMLHKLQEQVKEKDLSEVLPVNDNIDPKLNELPVRNIITEEIYHELSEAEIILRSRQMFEKFVSYFESSEPSILKMKNARISLPIADKRADILRLIDENQVVILSGETGCGKTTQVPQYILDHYIEKNKGANCNIVVTQPRRISAISIAERVANERGENKVGETVGHHVRLNKKLPKQNGAILYCSTGMLLRKLCSNPNLLGISHVIVDEVHERNIQIDFLLILLKRLLESNKNIKILIMSASFNTSVFSQYFNNCPTLHVPGIIYPVKEYYLEDLHKDIPGINEFGKNGPSLNVELVANVINYVHRSQKSGSILCFLPGWHDILSVQNKLLEICKDPSELKICCAHSRLPHEEQKNIFEHPPEGVRKVILATNIAETSITIDDVVYVVNSGLHKGTSFDGTQGIASLGTQWITKANVRQRRGRAGRVQYGVCYNIFTRNILQYMDDYPLPELLRTPLESVILDCKLYCPDSKAEDFLSTALQPPSRSSLQIGINELQMLAILDENENLTELGKIIVNFATHPRLSVALVYASLLGIKQGYDNYLYSDHLALSKIFDTWHKLHKTSEAEEFIKNNLLDEQSLHLIKDLKALFAESLFTAGIIEQKDAFSDPENKCNVNSNHPMSIFAALSVAFYPNVMKVIQGEISKGKLNKEAIVYSLVKGQRATFKRNLLLQMNVNFQVHGSLILWLYSPKLAV